MHLIRLDSPEMLAISVLVVWMGATLNRRIGVLERNFIPPAVTGGLTFALLAWLLHSGFGVALEFDMELRDLLLLVFFSTVGLSVRLATLKQGGRLLPRLIFAAGLFLVLQNVVGIGIAYLFGSEPIYGLMAGSVSFAGGHGTAIAWGAEFEAAGVENASAVGLVFATFGLVAGGLVGGPVAKRLMARNRIRGAEGGGTDAEGVTAAPSAAAETPTVQDEEWLPAAMRALLMVALCVSLGAVVNGLLAERGVMLPGFLTAMAAGILLGNFTRVLEPPAAKVSVDRFGTVSLHLFLAMSMMTIELWTLGGALQAVIVVLIAQVLLMTIFAVYVIFSVAGKDYDAVVMAAGFSGMGLGATPVAIANMNAVTSRYGASPKALLLIPLVGALFLDILNAGTIQYIVKLLQGGA